MPKNAIEPSLKRSASIRIYESKIKNKGLGLYYKGFGSRAVYVVFEWPSVAPSILDNMPICLAIKLFGPNIRSRCFITSL